MPKKKNTTRAKRAKRIKKLPGIWESITLLNYFGSLWRVVVFIGLYFALVTLYLVQYGLSPLSDTWFMKSIFEGLLLFVLAFAVYDGLLTTIIRRYPWHAKFDKFLLLFIEATIAAWLLFDGALSYVQIEGGLETVMSDSMGYGLVWLLFIAAIWPPVRVFIGVSHQAVTTRSKG